MPARQTLKQLLLLPTIFFCSTACAGLLGDYDKISGPAYCPVGAVSFAHDSESAEVIALIFGGRHTWPMTTKTRSVVRDSGANQCTYVWSTALSKNRFKSETTRTRCPSADHDDVVTETMVLQGKAMTYEFADKNTRFKCRYRKLSGA